MSEPVPPTPAANEPDSVPGYGPGPDSTPPQWVPQPAAQPPYQDGPYGPVQPPYGPPAVPSRRRRNTNTIVVITAGLAALVMALSVGGFFVVRGQLASRNEVTIIARIPPSAPPSATASATVPGAVTAAFAGDLRTLLLAKPTAAQNLPLEDWPDDGTVSAAVEAARTTSDPGASLTWLQDALGYKQGAWTAWLDHGRLILIVLHQFRGSNSANSWVSNRQSGLRDASSGFGPGMMITGVPDGLYFVLKAPLGSGLFLVSAYFGKGDLVAEVSVYTKTAAQPDRLVAVCQAQFARLP